MIARDRHHIIWSGPKSTLRRDTRIFLLWNERFITTTGDDATTKSSTKPTKTPQNPIKPAPGTQRYAKNITWVSKNTSW